MRESLIDARSLFQERADQATSHPNTNAELGRVVQMILPTDHEVIDINQSSSNSRWFRLDGGSGLVTDALRECGYHREADALEQDCLEAIYDGEGINEVRSRAMKRLAEIDSVLYEMVLNSPDYQAS